MLPTYLCYMEVLLHKHSEFFQIFLFWNVPKNCLNLYAVQKNICKNDCAFVQTFKISYVIILMSNKEYESTVKQAVSKFMYWKLIRQYNIN